MVFNIHNGRCFLSTDQCRSVEIQGNTTENRFTTRIAKAEISTNQSAKFEISRFSRSKIDTFIIWIKTHIQNSNLIRRFCFVFFRGCFARKPLAPLMNYKLKSNKNKLKKRRWDERVIFLIALTKDSTRARYSHKVFFYGAANGPISRPYYVYKSPRLS